MKSVFIVSALVAVVAVLSCLPAVGETVTFQDGGAVVSSNNTINIPYYSGTQDMKVRATNPTWGFGVSPNVNVGPAYGANYATHIRFDLSALAGKYSSIDSMTLRFSVESGGGMEFAYGAQVAQDAAWGEGTYNYGQIGAACYNYQQYATLPWAGGALGGAQDADVYGMNYANSSLSNYGSTWSTGTWLELPIDPSGYTTKQSGDTAPTTLTALVNEWIAQGAINGGMAIGYRNVTDNTVNITLDSREVGAAHQPELVIGFTPVPEPSTLVLTVAGLLGLLCYGWRKRK